MDRPDADPGELARSLKDLRRVNRWLGARQGAVRLVIGLARRVRGRPVRVLDVGTGAADIPLELVRVARVLDLPLRVIATDLHPVTLELARVATAAVPEIEIAVADALDLPFMPSEFDIAMSHTMLHHFGEEEAGRILAELDRVAGAGVVVTDLSRSRTALLGAKLLAATLWRRHPITRHDGPASVRAAYTGAELGALAADSMRGPIRVRGQPLFRISLVVDRTATVAERTSFSAERN